MLDLKRFLNKKIVDETEMAISCISIYDYYFKDFISLQKCKRYAKTTTFRTLPHFL